jgi:hypothetical protein
MKRVEELTLRWLDGQAAAAERDELARLVEADPEARRIHVGLVEIEVTLRARRPVPGVASGVMEQVGRERTDRAVRQIMRQVSSMTPIARGPRARPTRGWRPVVVALAFASAAAAAVAVVGVGAFRAGAPTTASAPPPGKPPAPAAGRAPAGAPPAVGRTVPDFAPVATLEETAPPPVPADPSEPIALVSHDFEAGTLPESFIDGHLAQGSCAPGSLYCALGTLSPFDASRNTVTIEQLKPPLVRFAPKHVLVFDYWVGADAPQIRVQMWVRARKQNYAVFLRDIVREQWGRAEIRFEDLRNYGNRVGMLPGDGVTNIMITAGRMGGAPFYVDNLKVLAYPEDSSLPVTSGALSLSR